VSITLILSKNNEVHTSLLEAGLHQAPPPSALKSDVLLIELS